HGGSARSWSPPPSWRFGRTSGTAPRARRRTASRSRYLAASRPKRRGDGFEHSNASCPGRLKLWLRLHGVLNQVRFASRFHQSISATSYRSVTSMCLPRVVLDRRGEGGEARPVKSQR